MATLIIPTKTTTDSFALADYQADFNAINADLASKTTKPTTSAGVVGEWKKISAGDNTALNLPSGGTWAYILLLTNSSTGVVNNFLCAVAAGGTLILSASPGYAGFAMVWRIA